MIQYGGLQAIVRLAIIENHEIRKYLLSAFHILATYPSLHEYMALTGAIKAINWYEIELILCHTLDTYTGTTISWWSIIL